MHSSEVRPFGPVRPVSGLAANEPPGAAQVTLSSVADWVELCQRCARSGLLSETRRQPAPEEPRRAVIIPLKTRRET